MIGRFFQIDPLSVAESSQFEYAFRAAAYRFVAGREEEEARKAKAAQKR
jgi:Tfp pilus assembly protein PilO